MAEDLCYADETFGLQTLYDQVHNGLGTATTVEPAISGLGKLAPVIGGSSGRIQAALRGTGVTWQGQAAVATASALQRVGQWADRAAQSAGTGGGKVQNYADSFVDLKSKVHKPEPVPPLTSWGSFWDQFGTMSDHAKAIQRNQQDATAAYQALAAHEQNTHAGVAGFPDVGQAPPITNPAGAGASSTLHHPGGGPAPGGGSGGAPAAGTAPEAPGGGGDGAAPGGHPGGGSGTPGAPTHLPTTNPTNWTPITPPAGANPGLPTGGSPPGLPPTGGPGLGGAPPPMGPLPGDATRFHTPGGGRNSGLWQRPLVSRGGSGESLGRPVGGPGPFGEPGGFGAAGRPLAGMGGLGGLSPMGGAGQRGQDQEHRNNVFIPSDEPFAVWQDDVVPAVLGQDEYPS